MNPLSRIGKFRISSPVFSGLVWSCIWLGIGTLVLSTLLAVSSLREDGILPWVFGIHGVASMAGGFVSARRSGRRGWYVGAVSGVLYALLVVIASFLSMDTDWSLRIAALLGISCLTGAFGGMIGVNAGAPRANR